MNPKENNSALNTKKYFTDSNIEILPHYTPLHQPTPAAGAFPFTSGIHPEMYRQKLWTMRQYAGFSTAKQSNERYHYLLKQGVAGLSVAFDLPTQIGYNANHPLAEGEVGKVGVSIGSIKDMEELFEGIELQHITTSMTINATAFILLAFYIALAKKQGADLTKISGTIQNDILKEYAARGTYIYPPKPSMRIITNIFEYCSHHLPQWNTISISGYHIREAGATAAQELAFTLANGKAYLQAAQKAGLNINVFGKRLSFFFNAHNNFLEEIAKFRAARRLWANITKQMGATDERAQMLRFHTQTAGSTLTAQQPLNNIARTTIQALAAVMGGTQSLHTNGYDEALSLPTEQAAQIALRTQQIIANESGIPYAVDPFAGSYLMEQLTNQIETKALEYMQVIDAMGGAVQAIENEYMQTEIAKSAYAYQQKIENKSQIIVGVNEYTTHEKLPANLLKVDDNIRTLQTQKLQNLIQNRNAEQAKKSLDEIAYAAKNNLNIMPAVIQAVENEVTLGEISDCLRQIFGEY